MTASKTYQDQTGRAVCIPVQPRRIISLVPSQTELLHYLGLEKETVGITKFCVHPADWFHEKTRVGGTKTVATDRVEKLRPDLIIGNKEENQKEQILALARQYPVWLSEVKTLEDAYAMIAEIGTITGTEIKAEELVRELRKRFTELHKQISTDRPRKTVAYFIWQKPLMAAAQGTFINEMLQVGGLTNVFADRGRYPEVTFAELRRHNPEVILLSSEPFPFRDKHIKEFAEICPRAAIRLVDGELFSWYGSRLLHTADYLAKLRESL